MERRNFLQGAALLGFGWVAGRKVKAEPAEDDWKDPRLKAISIQVPPFKGEYYEAEIPDTLELPDRAALAINAMTRLVNPKYDYAQYSYSELRHDPPYMVMEAGLTNLNPKWLEALPLTRIMSGSTQNADVDRHIIEGELHNTGFDGLTYQPPGRPGAFFDDFCRKQNKPAADINGESRQLIWLAIMDELTSDPVYRDLGNRKIDRLLEIAAREGNDRYFRRGRGYTPGEKDADKVPIMALTDHTFWESATGVFGTASARDEGSMAMGAARYYLNTGYQPALELARGTAHYFRNRARLIDEQGRWHGWHYHVMARALLGVAEYGLNANDEDTLQWVRRAYEYGRSIGDPALGFFAGVPHPPGEEGEFNPNAKECGMDHDRLETEPCSVSDMAILALKLTRAGIGDYYEDVEHYIRNMLVESQITEIDFLKSFPKEISQSKHVTERLKKWQLDFPGAISFDNVAEKTIGSFCNTRPNQWFFGLPGVDTCGCCVGNGGRALFYAWDSILESKGGELRVNLLLNRASPWADLDSYLPYEGKIVLKMKQPRDVLVGIPTWTNWKHVRCSVSGQTRPFEWVGRYIRVGSLRPGERLTVEFPMVENTLYRNLKGHDFAITMRGSTVVDVTPHAEITPVFRRERYRQSKAPMRRQRRFVSAQSVRW